MSYSAKAQLFPTKGFNITLGVQGMKQTIVNQVSWDAGMCYENDRFHIETKYLYKTYSHDAYEDVQRSSATAFRYSGYSKKSFLVRYDFMTSQWNGKTFGKDADGNVDYTDIVTSNVKRQRVIGGITFSLGGPFQRPNCG